jgi:putative peptidoglycan lipid II flippase
VSDSPSPTGTRVRSTAHSTRLERATLGMALGTFLSRVTGLARLALLAYALGNGPLADAFNLANNTPNIVHDLVLGGVLTATFVPVFVGQLARREAAEARASISAVVTLSGVVLVAATGLVLLFAPEIVGLLGSGTHRLGFRAESLAAADLLRCFAPQILFYGATALMTALANTGGTFVAPALVPVVNNLVAIGVLAWFAATGIEATPASLLSHTGDLVVLGLGTTAGVALQALALLPAARRASPGLRLRWDPRDIAVREVLRLSGWTFGFVLANQVAVFVVLALEVHLGHGAVSAYTYAFTFFQLPFGIVAVSVMSAVTPDLARRFSQGDLDGARARLATGTRQVLAVVVPAAVGYLVLAQPIVSLLLGHGAASAQGTSLTAATLTAFALGLPGYCLYLLAVRAFQAMRDTRTAFYLYCLENAANVLGAFLLAGPLGVRGLALSLALAYTLGAVVAYAVLRFRLRGISGAILLRSLLRTASLSVVMAAVVSVVTAAVGSSRGVGLAERVVAGVVTGVVVYFGTAGLAGSWREWKNAARQHAPDDAEGTHARHPHSHR